jgi:hypothetical protein
LRHGIRDREKTRHVAVQDSGGSSGTNISGDCCGKGIEIEGKSKKGEAGRQRIEGTSFTSELVSEGRNHPQM